MGLLLSLLLMLPLMLPLILPVLMLMLMARLLMLSAASTLPVHRRRSWLQLEAVLIQSHWQQRWRRRRPRLQQRTQRRQQALETTKDLPHLKMVVRV